MVIFDFHWLKTLLGAEFHHQPGSKRSSRCRLPAILLFPKNRVGVGHSSKRTVNFCFCSSIFFRQKFWRKHNLMHSSAKNQQPNFSPNSLPPTTNPATEFSVFSSFDPDSRVFLESFNNRAKRFCMDNKAKGAEKSQEPSASVTTFEATETPPNSLVSEQKEFQKPKQFVPPAVFSDYRQLRRPPLLSSWRQNSANLPRWPGHISNFSAGYSSNLPNVFAEIREEQQQKGKKLSKVEKSKSQPEIQVLPESREKTPELIDLEGEKLLPVPLPPSSSLINISSELPQIVAGDEEDDIQILDSRFREKFPSPIREADLDRIPRPSDSISVHFAEFRGIKRQWESAKLPAGALKKEKVKNAAFVANKNGDFSSGTLTFTLCSYNVLCQSTIGDTLHLYGHCGREDLEWDRRWSKLSKELKLLDADIFCLQEVQADHYQTTYRPFFENLGYECVFVRRTGKKEDGCATCWRKEKFELDSSTGVPYLIPHTLLNRDNVGLVVTLVPRPANKSMEKINKDQPNDSGRKSQKLVVANTHLLFNPKRGDIKLGQLALLLAFLDSAAARCPGGDSSAGCGSAGSSNYFPVILCGDLNSEPLSPLYNFVMSGRLKYEGEPQYELSGQGKFGGRIMDRALIPPQAGVTDSCQFVRRWQREMEMKGESGESDSDDCVVIEEGEVVEEGEEGEIVDSTVGNSKEKMAKKPETKQTHRVPPLSTGTLTHKFHFLSIYRHLTAKGDWELTTHTGKDSANVDYIFYTLKGKRAEMKGEQLVVKDVEEGDLRCLDRYRLLSQREMAKSVGKLPNKYCGSDHLPLMGKFQLKL